MLQFSPAILLPSINPLNAELNPMCHLLTLLGAHSIFHISRIRVNKDFSSYLDNFLYTRTLSLMKCKLWYKSPLCLWSKLLIEQPKQRLRNFATSAGCSTTAECGNTPNISRLRIPLSLNDIYCLVSVIGYILLV